MVGTLFFSAADPPEKYCIALDGDTNTLVLESFVAASDVLSIADDDDDDDDNEKEESLTKSRRPCRYGKPL